MFSNYLETLRIPWFGMRAATVILLGKIPRWLSMRRRGKPCVNCRDIAPVGGIQDHDVPKEVKTYQIQVAVECLVTTFQTPIQGFSRG